MVYPQDRFLERYQYQDGKYGNAEVFGEKGRFKFTAIDAEISLAKIFKIEE